MKRRVYTMPLSVRKFGGGIGSNGGGELSHESDHDLAMLVGDFLESGNNNSSGTDSIYSSDSDSALADLPHLLRKISYIKLVTDQYESDLISVVNSLVLSIKEIDLQASKSGLCHTSCIRFLLVKRLKLYGYDAGVCTSRWQTNGEVPGGDHEYIDILLYNDERVIIDIDFRSHFEIARAVDSYSRLLSRLPVIYVGSVSKLEQFLHVMAEAARSSLKQNSMYLPPWRSFAYLQSKWLSQYDRRSDPIDSKRSSRIIVDTEHNKCAEHLGRLRASLLSEIEDERVWPFESDKIVKAERRRRRCLNS